MEHSFFLLLILVQDESRRFQRFIFLNLSEMTTESSIPSQMEEFPQEDPWYLGTTFLVSISLLCVTLLLLLIYRKMVVILIKTAPRDFRIVVGFIRVVKTLKIWGIKNMSVGKIFDIIAARYPDKVCFYFENEEWTFSQVIIIAA